MKTCTRCLLSKHQEEFVKSSRSKDGWHSQCKSCHAERAKIYRAENPHILKDQYKKRWQYVKEWNKNNPEKSKLYARRYYLKYTYGITLTEYDKMRKEQNYSCYTCNEHESIVPRKSEDSSNALCVDHCHESGKIRKLLCMNCNVIIGLCKENKTTLFNLIDYIGEHSVHDTKTCTTPENLALPNVEGSALQTSEET